VDNTDKVAQLYEDAERQAAEAAERVVGSGGFASLLGMLAENAAAVTKLGADAMDLALRNARLAGRRDVIRLGVKLARTEDKLERVLQEVEALRDEVRVSREDAARAAAANGDSGRKKRAAAKSS
jgi:hypothetical protein